MDILSKNNGRRLVSSMARWVRSLGYATKAEVEQAIDEATGLPIVEQTEAAVTIEPEVLNRWGEVASLTLDFAPSKDGYAGEYCVEFVSGATPTSLSLPAAVTFPDEVSIEANTRYQLSVVNNLGLIAGVAL